MLDREQIFKAADNVKPGTIVRIGYKTELPVKSEYKKKGIQVIKIVETSVRLGVSYTHIAEVVARKQNEVAPVRNATNNYVWLIKNKVRHNTKTGKDYLYVANFNGGHHTRSLYKVIDGDGCSVHTKESFINSKYKNCLIDSYWNTNGASPEVKNISFENIFKVGDVGHSMKEEALSF